MASTLGERDVRPLTADEVMRMVELGVLREDEPVELLHGALTRVTPKSPEHGAVHARLVVWLAPAAAAAGGHLRSEHPLAVPDDTSLPEPDLAVVEGAEDPRRHPTTALLVVEVAVGSLATDTKIKPALYAAAGVPALWVVDVPARRVEVFAEPGPGGYARRASHAPPAALAPPSLHAPPLDLAALFAGL